jgi:YD repeat-containing protein
MMAERIAFRVTALLVLTGVVTVVGSGSASAGSVAYVYDDAGRLKTVTYSNGTQTSYALDPAGNRTSVSSTLDTSAPSTPSGLAVSGTNGSQISLAWRASSDNFQVAGYQLERCPGSGCTNFATVAVPSGTTYTDAGLPQATTYSYRVRAADPAGNLSGYSGTVVAATLDVTPPSAPGAFSLNASASQITLSWNPSTDNVGVSAYLIERCQGSGCSAFSQIGTTGATSYADTGLPQVTTYSYRVRATDAAGNLSAYSSAATATTPDISPPTTPAWLTATYKSGTQINLRWAQSTDNVGVAGYAIYRCQGAGCSNFAQVGTATLVPYSDTGVTARTTYTYVVAAYDAAGNTSGFTSPVTVTPLDPLSATISTNLWQWVKPKGYPAIVDPPVTVTASGGSGSYTYAWVEESGDSAATAKTPSSSSTQWTAQGLPKTIPADSVWHCIVTDSNGQPVYSPDVTVHFEIVTQ